MLQNAYLLAKIGADTAERDRNFAEIREKRCRHCAAFLENCGIDDVVDGSSGSKSIYKALGY